MDTAPAPLMPTSTRGGGSGAPPRGHRAPAGSVGVRAGLPPKRLHDMRLSCPTILAAQDVPLSETMGILGHSTIAVTMRYVHSLPKTRRRAAAKVDSVLKGSE
jgi:integrase